jgi:hypothetical protein
MKKLLALILCVMMFVSIVPTAFAADPADANHTTPVYPSSETNNGVNNKVLNSSTYKKEIDKMVSNTRKAIATSYEVLTMSESVYGTAKAMDDTVVGLVDALTKDLIGEDIWVRGINGLPADYATATNVTTNGNVTYGKTQFKKAYADTIKDNLRLIVDAKVADEMSKNTSKYMDGTKIKPIQYAQTFANAVSKALTNKDFQKGYEAVATYFAVNKIMKDVRDEIETKYDDFQNSVDTSFDKDFYSKYPELSGKNGTNYIDALNATDTTLSNMGWAAELWPYPMDMNGEDGSAAGIYDLYLGDDFELVTK